MVHLLVQRLIATGLLASALLVGACQSLPYADDDRLPVVVAVADGSIERAALNQRVWDAAIPLVARRFYVKDYGGTDWPSEAAARRNGAVDQPDEVTFYGVLNETLALLDDRHTRATRPAINLRRAESRLGQGMNFGFSIAEAEGRSVVVEVIDGGPAAAAGVKVGWLIDTVDGQPFDLQRSLAGQPRLFRFLDAVDQAYDVEMTAAIMPRVLGTASRTPENVLVLWLSAFDQLSGDWFLDRLRTELADPPRGIVVDLRGNPGGNSGDIGRLLSPFLADGTIYAEVEARSLLGQKRSTRRRDLSFDGPMAVLTSARSASAAELFAAAIQEAGRGAIVGGRTAGAVVGATHHDLTDGGRLSVGFTAVRTGGGVLLEKVGVTPDIPTKGSLVDLRAGRDPTLIAAIEALNLPDTPQAGSIRSQALP